MKLAIGTAQFGMAYGVTNTSGQVAREDVAAILQHAHAAGCDTIDTAVSYGAAERVLGAVGIDTWRVVTKLPALPDDERDVQGWVTQTLQESLTRLRQPRVYGVLLHQPAQLLGPRGAELAASLEMQRTRGLVEKLGVSVYGPMDLESLWLRMPIDIVQAPYSVLDRRLHYTGWLDRLIAAGIEFHARSVFLQGLLVAPPAARPAWTQRWSSLWKAYDAWLENTGGDAAASCLAFVMSDIRISRVVVGVAGLAQWVQLVAAHRRGVSVTPPSIDAPEDLLLPSRWPS